VLVEKNIDYLLKKYTFTSFLKMPIGFYQSLRLLKKINPDVVLGFGGYLSIPVVISSYFLKIPSVIHEQTFGAGVANKILSKFASKVLISWESSRKFFPFEKTYLTGNPIKEDIVNAKNNNRADISKKQIYITGGSTGSHVINVLVEKNIGYLLKKYSLVHQTGDSKKYNDFERLKNIRKNLDSELSEKYKISKFFNSEESAKLLISADLIMGRAGINTVTELLYLEKPALLIPIPFAQMNEQLKNAQYLNESGLGEFLIQNEITSELFLDRINFMMENIKNYKLKNKINFDNSSKKIVKILNDVSKKKTS
ncbi:MAG TPA: glycosyltransferase, partial [Candidatus Sulfotelmatobacter sp.]|nr:glycosyltransferase [Candidatus Sulfotelmatobacter sp.]